MSKELQEQKAAERAAYEKRLAREAKARARAESRVNPKRK